MMWLETVQRLLLFLAQAIIREGLKNVAAGANPMGIKRGIEKAVKVVVADIKANAKLVETSEAIAQVASISASDKKSVNSLLRPWKKSAKTALSPLKKQKA